MMRRLLSMFLILALAVGMATASVRAADMLGAMTSGVSHSMPDSCPDCDDDAVTMAGCAQTVCAAYTAIVSSTGAPFSEALSLRPAAYDEDGVGLARLPDQRPPRTTFLR